MKVKGNVVERLEKEIGYADGVIGIGTVTDPYQYAEARFGVTRNCLEVLHSRGCKIHMHTKSDLILRDADIIAEMDSVVGITITNIEDRPSKIAEPGAPLPAKRFEALKQLTDASVKTYALVGPILNSLEGKEAQFVSAIAETGVKTMCLDKLNLRPLLGERIRRMNLCGSQKALENIRTLAKSSGIDVSDAFP